MLKHRGAHLISQRPVLRMCSTFFLIGISLLIAGSQFEPFTDYNEVLRLYMMLSDDVQAIGGTYAWYEARAQFSTLKFILMDVGRLFIAVSVLAAICMSLKNDAGHLRAPNSLWLVVFLGTFAAIGMCIGAVFSVFRDVQRMEVLFYQDTAQRSVLSLYPTFLWFILTVFLIGLVIAFVVRGGAPLRSAFKRTGALSAIILTTISIPFFFTFVVGLTEFDWIFVSSSLIWIWVLIATRASIVEKSEALNS